MYSDSERNMTDSDNAMLFCQKHNRASMYRKGEQKLRYCNICPAANLYLTTLKRNCIIYKL